MAALETAAFGSNGTGVISNKNIAGRCLVGCCRKYYTK